MQHCCGCHLSLGPARHAWLAFFFKFCFFTFAIHRWSGATTGRSHLEPSCQAQFRQQCFDVHANVHKHMY